MCRHHDEIHADTIDMVSQRGNHLAGERHSQQPRPRDLLGPDGDLLEITPFGLEGS